MSSKNIIIEWPDGRREVHLPDESLLEAAEKAGIKIPIGCLRGSCGTCEIDVNGETVRACMTQLSHFHDDLLKVKFIEDPYW